MTDSTLTFRDFAGAVMAGDVPRAGTVLETLLELDEPAARAAAEHFQSQMQSQGQDFMMKAMGLRTAVTGGDAGATTGLLQECFGLDESAASSAREALAKRYAE